METVVTVKCLEYRLKLFGPKKRDLIFILSSNSHVQFIEQRLELKREFFIAFQVKSHFNQSLILNKLCFAVCNSSSVQAS